MSCSISIEAYCLLLLHPAKYPTCSTCGLLIGVLDQYDPSKTIITDALPVCHTAPMGPIFDFAADMATKANKNHENIGVIGCYQCHAHSDQISPYIEKICASVKKRNGTSVCINIKNKVFSNFSHEKLNISCSRDHQELHCDMYNAPGQVVKHTIASANQVVLALLKCDVSVNVNARGLLSDVEEFMSHDMNNKNTNFFNEQLITLIQEISSGLTI